MAEGQGEHFSAQVSEWVAKTKKRMTAVRNESVQQVIQIMQTPVGHGGNMPVDTGFLRASGQALVGDNLPGLQPHPGGKGYDWDPGAITLVIAGAKLEDTITFAYTAEYAVYQEYGTRYMQGHRFVGLAAQQWPRIVEEVCHEAQARFE